MEQKINWEHDNFICGTLGTTEHVVLHPNLFFPIPPFLLHGNVPKQIKVHIVADKWTGALTNITTSSSFIYY
jgi:hypothetical protein